MKECSSVCMAVWECTIVGMGEEMSNLVHDLTDMEHPLHM